MNKKRMPKSPSRYGDGNLHVREPNKIWHIRWREVRPGPNGKSQYLQHSESTHSSDKQFAQRMLRAKLQATGGRRPTDADPTKVSYEELRDNLLAHYTANRRRSLRWRDKKPTLDTLPWLDEFFGSWRAAQITVADLKRFRSEGKAQGMSDARVNRYMATLRSMFNQARKDELVTRTEVPAYFPMVKEPNEARGAVFVDPAWYGPLRKRLKEPLRSAFTLAYAAGIRVGELERLTWKDVDTTKRVIHLTGDITKTGKPRSVPLPSDFDRKPGKGDDLLFPPKDRRETWRGACVSVGAGWYECLQCGSRCDAKMCPTHGKLNVRRLRYRGLLLRHCRHTAVRNMSDAGLPEARIMAISGHVTRSMFDRYNIGREKDVAAAREAIETFHRAQQKKLKPGR